VPAVYAYEDVIVFNEISLWVPGLGGLLAFAAGQRGLWPASGAR
jgi:hypothetical protein